MEVSAKFENTDDMELTVSATMRVALWKKIYAKLDGNPYYGPAADLACAVESAIRKAESKVVADQPVSES